MPGLNSVREKSKTIVLRDNKEYILRFDLNALAELEESYGTAEKAFKAMEDGSFKAIRKVLWAGLLNNEPELSERQVGALIDVETLQALTTTLSDAVDADLPTIEEVKETSPN